MAGGLGLPLPFLPPQLPQVEWLGPTPNRLKYITQRETVFWDWTFLTPNGREQPRGLIPQLGPQASTGICKLQAFILASELPQKLSFFIGKI